MSKNTSQPQQIDVEQLADVAMFAQAVLISRSKLYDLKAAGQLPRPIKLGRCVRWRLSDINAWIAAGCPSQERFEAMRKAGAR